MQRASRIAMLVAGLLGCSCALADDFDVSAYESLLPADFDTSLDLYARSDSYRALDSLEFYDNSALGRLKRLRDVSFLTLAESGQTRVFFGVDRDGLVGLHFRIR